MFSTGQLFRCFFASIITVFMLLSVLWTPGIGEASGKGPNPGTFSLDESGEMHISPEDRCPVCAMKSYNHPKTSCAIQLQSGNTFYFCGTGCLIKSWVRPDKYLSVTESELKRAVVREYFTGRTVDALSVTWVAGSDVVGPMGRAIVPLLGDDHLKAFQRRHGGQTVFSLKGLTEADLMKILGK
jgi:nitrous oxide reductase accessory protein NosL